MRQCVAKKLLVFRITAYLDLISHGVKNFNPTTFLKSAEFRVSSVKSKTNAVAAIIASGIFILVCFRI
jgi:hypothetical protein